MRLVHFSDRLQRSLWLWTGRPTTRGSFFTRDGVVRKGSILGLCSMIRPYHIPGSRVTLRGKVTT